MNTAQINFNVIDQSFSQDGGQKGISGFMGVFQRGPVGRNDEVFSSWPQFRKVYGGLVAGLDAPLLAKRAFARGSKLRICGIRNFALISNPSSITAVTASTATLIQTVAGDELFSLYPKYPGADYNKLQVNVTPSLNGDVDAFDIKISLVGEPDYPAEIYRNIKIVGTPTAEASDYLKDIVAGSRLMNVTYEDLTGNLGVQKPVPVTVNYTGGTNGAAVTATDYLGDAGAQNGIHAFDGYSDILAIGSDTSLAAVATGGAAYAGGRRDIQYFHHFDNNLVTAAQVTAAKAALNIDTPYIQFWTGGVDVLDPLTNSRRKISAMGDILGAQAQSDLNFGAHYSFAGLRRGFINDVFDVANNFGSNSDLTSLNQLAQHQINAVVNIDGQVYLSGNFSGQRASSHLSFNNTVRLIISIQRLLRPVLKQYIEEPNDFPTWKEIFLMGSPIMDSLKTKRAIFSYDWQGDQYVTRLEDLSINDATEVGQGKYRIRLFIKDIVSLQEITFDIIITPSGVSFEDSLSLING